jgi:4-aminobutyrate aminotransferase
MSKDKRFEREQGDINTTANRRKYWKRNLSETAKKWFEEDTQYFLHQSLSTPVLNVLSKAQGIYLEDLDGKQYIDMHGNGVHNAGFNNAEVIKALKKQLDAGMSFCPRRYTNIPAIALAKKLAEIAPGDLCRSLFCPGGSEAIEMAIMLAKLITGHFKTISYWDSYHGTGMGAASVGGEEHFRGGLGPMMPGALHVEFPNYYRNPWGFDNQDDVDTECLRQIEVILQREPEMAAIIGEPISATPMVPTQRYWQGVKKLCEEFGALLIFDEIIEGFGRTGKMFASEYYVTPDVLVLGKSLGGGLVPFAGIVTYDRYNTLQHRSIGHYTHEKNALCAIGDVTGVGLHIGIDLVKDPKTKERAVDEAEIIMFKCLEKGLSFKTIEGNVITLRPALVITQEEIDRALGILEGALDEVERGKKY